MYVELFVISSTFFSDQRNQNEKEKKKSFFSSSSSSSSSPQRPPQWHILRGRDPGGARSDQGRDRSAVFVDLIVVVCRGGKQRELLPRRGARLCSSSRCCCCCCCCRCHSSRSSSGVRRSFLCCILSALYRWGREARAWFGEMRAHQKKGAKERSFAFSGGVNEGGRRQVSRKFCSRNTPHRRRRKRTNAPILNGERGPVTCTDATQTTTEYK